MRRELDAPPGVGLLEYVAGLPTQEEQTRASAVIHRHEMQGARTATWMPGAEETLRALHRRGVPTAIVTRNSRDAARLTMDRLEMPPVPLKAREDAAPKPDPEALLALAAVWGLEPATCAYVGDFCYDTEAAERAGMLPVLYVPPGRARPEGSESAELLRDFAALLAWI